MNEIISNVFNDKNINKDEKYMFLMFISKIKEIKDEIIISITSLMEVFQTKCKKKILEILKSLENKGYIEIIKSVGKTNKYRIIKNYFNNIINNLEHDNKENQYSYENYYTGDFYSKNTSINEETSNCVSSGDLDTSSKIVSSNFETGSYFKLVNKEHKNIVKQNESAIFNKDILNYKNNKLYINIFNIWNKTKINNEKVLYESVKNTIKNSIDIYGEKEIINAIKNYSEIFYSDYYYDYRWSLVNFLKKENGIKRFLNNGDIWNSYNLKFKKQIQEEKLKINIEDYID